MKVERELEYYKDYFEAVLFGESDMRDSSDFPEMLSSVFSIYDIDENSLKAQIKQLDEFFQLADETLENTDYTHGQACHDFYFTRVGHGVGFWENDHCEDTEGKKLTEIAEKFGQINCWVENGIVFIE